MYNYIFLLKYLAYCKLYTNFATVFNKLKINIMKQRNLESCTDEELLGIYSSLDYILFTNERTKILSRSELSIINNWEKQIDKVL